MITLNDNGTITQDNISLNNASDALLNRFISSADFMQALQTALDNKIAIANKAQSDIVYLQSQMLQQLNNDLNNLQTLLSSTTDSTQLVSLNAQLALVQKYIGAASTSPDQLRAQSLAADIAAKQAELAALQDT